MLNDNNRRPIKKKYWMIILCLTFVLVGSYFIYYQLQQNKIQIKEPEGFSIETKTENLTLAGVKWIEVFSEQFYQRYLPQNQKLVDYYIEDIYILEDNVIQIDFTVATKLMDEESASIWKGSLVDSKIQSQWVVWFDKENTVNDTIIYTAMKLQSPAGYDLEKYQTSGEKEKDEFEHEYIDEIPFEEMQYTYKIENNKCYASYNRGNTWVEVPVNLETLAEIGDGHSYYNQLQKGSYLITPEKTAFVYGGTNQSDFMITYSDDKGINWNTVKISELNSTRLKFISFPTVSVGYVIATSERTMSQELQLIYKTTDGGTTWKEMGYGPSTWLLISGGFVDENIGFMSYPKVEGAETNFYRTSDGGISFEPITLPVYREEWMGTTFEPFIQPETPYLENGDLFVMVGQGSQGDFKGGTIMAKYKSEDMGETWTFVELVEPPSKEIG